MFRTLEQWQALTIKQRVQNALSRRPQIKGQFIESVNYAHENGIDKKEIREWKWRL
jgi:phosphoketolase